MNKYDKVLSLCVGQHDLRQWMNKPFLYKDKVYATDAHIMCCVPTSLVEAEYSPIEHSHPENVVCVMSKPIEPLLRLTLAEIKAIKESCPMVDDYDEKGEEKQCDCCDGYGTVEYEFSYKKDYFTEEHDCPICKGDGKAETKVKVPNGKKVIDDKAMVQIGLSYFGMEWFKVLVEICEIMESDAVLVSGQISNKPSLFQIGDILFLIMPTYYDGVEVNPFFKK